MLRPVVSEEVGDALRDAAPVVALESTIFSNLGLPSPDNRTALDRCLAAIRSNGAVPAITGVLDGEVRLGIEPVWHDRVLGPARKVAERDLPVAVAKRWEFGATTVSATVAIAAAGGVAVFSTGGIGGVHRGAGTSFDVSADLDALATHPVVTVCAGAKAFLDLPATLEYLETRGVPVLGWRHDWFPAFYTRSSGLTIPHRVENSTEVALVLAGRSRPSTGVLLTVPVPTADELDPALVEQAIETALDECRRDGVTGPAVTPFVLGRIAAASNGRSVPANLALAEQNAAVAAEVATALTSA
ncbi:MAG: pseudouridine-5'-phosphate glycosidase [Actinomycetota bacterium]|nr:pseudouridine-5'-phosphate glycosidase [Actinomycetota bacterium]